jgi:hypothetical protein
MTERRAVVLVDGVLKELPTGDTLAGVSGGSSILTATAEVDFGSVGTSMMEVIVPAAWAGTATPFSVTISPNLTDHDYEDVIVEQMKAIVGEVDVGIGFTVYVHAPEDTWGRYNVTIRGIA